MKLPERFTTVTPFSKLLALFLFFLLPIIGFKFGAYYQKKLSVETSKPAVKEPNTVNPIDQIVIDDGNLYKVTDQKLLVDKAFLNKVEDLYITKIIKAEYSPDKTKILFSAEGGISAYILFYSDRDGKNIKSVGYIGEAVWSPTSRYIAFTQRPADVGPLQLYLYDTQTNKRVKLDNPPNRYRSYTEIMWDSAGNIEANYTEFDEIVNGKLTDQGRSTVAISDFAHL